MGEGGLTCIHRAPMSSATPPAVLWLQVLPPIRARASSTITCFPAEVKSAAAASPAMPAPTTITSAEVGREPNDWTVLFGTSRVSKPSRAAETRLSWARALADAILDDVSGDERNAMIRICDALFSCASNVSQCADADELPQAHPGSGMHLLMLLLGPEVALVQTKSLMYERMN